MSLDPKPTADQMRAYREAHECSLQEAKAALMKQWRVDQLEALARRCSIGMDHGSSAAYMMADLIELLREDLK